MSRNLFAIPDIHGRLDLLDQLLAKMGEQGFDPTQDKLIFLGDMIDRGKDSKGVLDRIWELTLKHPQNIIALAGNHEWLAIDACSRPGLDGFQLWMWNGGGQTLDSFAPPSADGMRARMPDHYVKWMASLPLSHEEPGFFFSHAPVPSESIRGRLQGQPFTKSELTWTSERPEGMYARDFSKDDGKQVVGVCGHIHGLPDSKCQPRFYEHYIFADSGCGCYYKAPLVAIEVRFRKITYAYPVEAMETRSEASL